jgi:hypothetical protein
VDWQNVISVGATIVALTTLAGLGLLRGTVIGLREQLNDERGLTASLRARRDEDAAKIAQLTTDLAALGRVVTGEAHWIAIADQLEEHHGVAVIHWKNERELLDEIRKNTAP